MNKYLCSILLTVFLLGSCAPTPIFPTPPPIATVTQTITPSRTPRPTQTAIPTTTNYSITQIRIPSDTDGRHILTAFWSQDGMAIYFALINNYSDAPVWHEISLANGQIFQETKLSSPPKLAYTPLLEANGINLEYQGLISPSSRYRFQIIQTDSYSLYLLDDISQSKVKLLETSDLNFRGAYWIPGETKVVFGIGPEYGTEIYLYDIGERKLIPSIELIGYADWNVSAWVLSPNGKYIAILDGNQNLHIFSLDGSYTITIPGYQNNVRWAGNSQRIYFDNGEQIYNPTHIEYFDIQTKIREEIIQISTLEELGIYGLFDVSPDGNQLIVWGAGKIWLLSL